MGFIELFLVGVGLSMDAFAVSICKGLGMRQINVAHMLVIALFFGGFQALMPVIGWALGSQFQGLIEPIDHWIAFGLLAFIGGKMLWDSFHEGNEEKVSDKASSSSNTNSEAPVAAPASVPAFVEGGQGSVAAAESVPARPAERLNLGELLMLAVATSIDALAVGISFAFLGVNIVWAVAIIGVTTFALSCVGVAIGNRFGSRYERGASIAGGTVLILIGLKILIEHLLG